MTGIFISYRRLESKLQARILFERLEPLFRGRVFMDVDGLKPGENFRDKIGRQLEHCTVLLALIGPQWETVRDAQGNVRLDDSRDWVRLEIATALQRGIMVVPVLVERTQMPSEAQMPEDLRPMLDRQAFVLNLDHGFDQGMRDLVEAIRPRMGRGVPGWVKWAIPAVGLVAGGGYLGVNPSKWLEAAPAPAALAVAAPVPAPPAPPPDPFPAGKKFRDCEDAACPMMVVIPAGTFLMGSPDSEPERSSAEGPQHRVSVAKFAMGQFEVTQGQWKALMGNNPSHFSACGDECPVDNVSWDMAQEYVKKLSAKTGQKYRLPSEAEWEYAARAGTRTPFHTGETITTGQANFDGNYTYNGSAKGEYRQKTMQGDSFKANDFGLNHMHGNVWEWVQDCWHENYENAPINGESWETNCNDTRRVLRGGSWDYDPRFLRSALRNGVTPDYRYYSSGFRIARTFSL